MLQEIKTLRDFLDKEDLKHLPLQLENCLLYKKWEVDKDGVSRNKVYVFDSGTRLIGVIEDPHWIPERS